MLCSFHWQLLPQTPTTNTATRRMEHIAELELLLARFWLPFGFGERKTNKKKDQTNQSLAEAFSSRSRQQQGRAWCL